MEIIPKQEVQNKSMLYYNMFLLAACLSVFYLSYKKHDGYKPYLEIANTVCKPIGNGLQARRLNL